MLSIGRIIYNRILLKIFNSFLFVLLFQSSIIFGQNPTNDQHWQRIWRDDFDFFNYDLWIKKNNYDHGGEQQVFLDKNVSILNSCLKLDIFHEPYTPPSNAMSTWGCNRYHYDYTSGCVESNRLSDLSIIKYGYLEARIKVPYGVGLWPAFWLYKTNDGTNLNKEIDIFEINPGRTELCPTAYGNIGLVHNNYWLMTGTPPYGVNYIDDNGCHENFGLSYVNDYTQWHKYGIEWTPNKIIWYIDDNIVRVSQNSNINCNMYVIFNISISNYTPVSSSTNFPLTMLIDYFELWKLKNDCETNLNVCNFDFVNLDNFVKKNISIGGNGCINVVPNNNPVFLRASESITINGDFTVPLGSELYLDVNSCYE